MREAQTRQEIIDLRLRLAGWNVEDASHVTEELRIEGGPTLSGGDEAGHDFSDSDCCSTAKPSWLSGRWLCQTSDARLTLKEAEGTG